MHLGFSGRLFSLHFGDEGLVSHSGASFAGELAISRFALSICVCFEMNAPLSGGQVKNS